MCDQLKNVIIHEYIYDFWFKLSIANQMFGDSSSSQILLSSFSFYMISFSRKKHFSNLTLRFGCVPSVFESNLLLLKKRISKNLLLLNNSKSVIIIGTPSGLSLKALTSSPLIWVWKSSKVETTLVPFSAPVSAKVVQSCGCLSEGFFSLNLNI